jgi:DNA-binding response OmpR family regulator
MPSKRTPRIHADDRTQSPQPSKTDYATRLVIGSLAIDRLRYEVTVGSERIHLTSREFELLWALASHPGKVLHREELLSSVWGKGIHVGPRTVDVHLAKLRQKLRSAKGQPDFLETIWGVGYRLWIG